MSRYSDEISTQSALRSNLLSAIRDVLDTLEKAEISGGQQISYTLRTTLRGLTGLLVADTVRELTEIESRYEPASKRYELDRVYAPIGRYHVEATSGSAIPGDRKLVEEAIEAAQSLHYIVMYDIPRWTKDDAENIEATEDAANETIAVELFGQENVDAVKRDASDDHGNVK